MLYSSVSDLDFHLQDLPALPMPRRVLLTTPAHFDVQYVINPHMEGNLGSVDIMRAREQWRELRDVYERIGIDVSGIDGAAGLPDMVFCANQTLPYLRPDTGEKGIILSRMHAPQRRGEVEHYARFFGEEGYEVRAFDRAELGDFEGMGDAIWHPGRLLLWGGHGFRTDRAAYERIAEDLGVRVILVLLEDPDFYHLDTCFSVLDERSVLVFPGAFTDDGLALVRHFFPAVIEAPEDEARRLFACNAHCPDGRHVIIQRGCTVTNERLRAAGFEVVEVDTDEFLKSGGSVFCMKQMFW